VNIRRTVAEIGELPRTFAGPRGKSAMQEHLPARQESRGERSASVEPFCLLPSAFYK
jgi:hypothetical protein